MPYVEGESLRERLRRDGPLALDETVRIACEVADGLDYAHGHGVIHRDIKPENILLAAGHALIADFGIARALVDTGAQAFRPDEAITQSGTVMGSPTYMSPEQASGEPVLDGRVDQDALAVVVYEMLSGMPPFTGTTPQTVLARHIMAERRRSSPRAVGAARRRRRHSEGAGPHSGRPVPDRGRLRPRAGGGRDEGRSDGVAADASRVGRAGRRAPARAGRGGVVGGPPERVGAEAARRLAVLPFENVGDAESAYFADGVTDVVRGKLSGLPGLQVIACPVRPVPSHLEDMRDIGRELGARYLVVGKVRWQKSGASSRCR